MWRAHGNHFDSYGMYKLFYRTETKDHQNSHICYAAGWGTNFMSHDIQKSNIKDRQPVSKNMPHMVSSSSKDVEPLVRLSDCISPNDHL